MLQSATEELMLTEKYYGLVFILNLVVRPSYLLMNNYLKWKELLLTSFVKPKKTILSYQTGLNIMSQLNNWSKNSQNHRLRSLNILVFSETIDTHLYFLSLIQIRKWLLINLFQILVQEFCVKKFHLKFQVHLIKNLTLIKLM